MKTFPLNIDVLKAARDDLLGQLGDLSPFPKEYRDTFANSFYCKHYVLVFGQSALVDLLAENMRLGVKASDYSHFISAVVINGANSIVEMRAAMQEFSQNDQNYWAALLVDSLKYNIPDAGYKSLLRRTVERRFTKQFPEHPNLWEVMMRTPKR